MGYSEALEKAGCRIINFKEFGSYQGTWCALVEYEGETGIVEGAYGSCSGCDAFQAEFDYDCEPTKENGKYYKSYRTWDEDEECTEEEFRGFKKALDIKLADFGKYYLQNGLYNKSFYENKLKNLREDDWFDQETKEMCEWVINQNF